MHTVVASAVKSNVAPRVLWEALYASPTVVANAAKLRGATRVPCGTASAFAMVPSVTILPCRPRQPKVVVNPKG